MCLNITTFLAIVVTKPLFFGTGYRSGEIKEAAYRTYIQLGTQLLNK